jgi:hypothetical protein
LRGRPRRHHHTVALLSLILSSSVIAQAACGWHARRSGMLPAALGAAEFWDLGARLSEPAGQFDHSDNLVSNEIRFVHNVWLLRASGGVYIGVGPEQNFSYIARLQPAMAFIIDIRQENRNLHLLYKALFELSSDRADFLSRLFSRERPAGVGAKTTVQDLFALYGAATAGERLYEANLRLVRERLLGAHGLPLSPPDVASIEYAFKAFYSHGPDLHYSRLRADDSPGPSYRTLMTAPDLTGRSRSYLATEEGFAFVKDLQARNLIVPIVGDFAGPAALRRTGEYIRQQGAVVKAFYGSNVEVYLNRQQRTAFCSSLAALPHDSDTRFIGSRAVQPFAAKLTSCTAR